MERRTFLLSVPPARVRALAAEARERIVLGAPLGGEWAWDSGCGVGREETPGEEPEAYGGLCGMGHVQAHERRMLLFWDA